MTRRIAEDEKPDSLSGRGLPCGELQIKFFSRWEEYLAQWPSQRATLSR
jgi:hypothetical protein